ncbi:MAG: 50S ribosomal protein L10 [Deltaproteobacteria bacterium]|nr:50S ribosomal protein L10 [Deltaproteobacteria bacterium]NND30711.1 50S ribosomal protein L10 [Myxococcales bacterium]MBT8464517.1 50S ribosomal protein L10 [Deltaproteobacteria bacterium]MBT8482705.1 50S ribosomal protein L10 [Deltaproteobacteria bacterium]NNK06918.1 50S ribosomal protein L10 [Myxococcales bacterium]
MSLTREDKAAQAVSVRESFANASATVLVDFRGVNVELITDLRSRFRDAGVEYKVVKNNVVRKALEGSELAGNEEFTAHLTGPTAIAWSFEDPSAAAKVIKSFRKEHTDVLQPKDGNEKLLVKCGLLEGQVLDARRVEKELASLPGKDEIRASLLAQLMAPMQNLVGQINAPAQNLALVLDAYRRKEAGE